MKDMSIIETVRNGNNVTIADDKIFDFVHTYARFMGELEEVEHNYLMLNQPYSTYDCQQHLMDIEVLECNLAHIEFLYGMMEDYAQEYYKPNLRIYRNRTSVMIELINKWQNSSSELDLTKRGLE